MKSLKSIALVLTFALSLVTAAQAAQVLTSPLVGPTWLAANMDDVVILDVRKNVASFTSEGHIPGAVLVNWSDVRSKRTIDGVDLLKMIPAAEDFEALMQKSGVDLDSNVVITFAGETTDDVTFATRLYWQLKYFGHDEVALLNGGTSQWVADGYALTTEATVPYAGSFMALKEEADMYGTTAEVADGIEDQNVQLVDVRSGDYYLGLKTKSYVYAPGHVPTAKNFYNGLLYSDEAPLTFLSADAVSQALEAAGIDPFGATITICNSGHKASGLWFVLHELIGNKKVQLYDGSMHEWTLDPSRPLSTTME